MMPKNKEAIGVLQNRISKEKKTIQEIISFFEGLKKTNTPDEEKMIMSQVNLLINSLKKTNESIPNLMNSISLIKPLPSKKENTEIKNIKKEVSGLSKLPKKKDQKKEEKVVLTNIEKNILKRIKKKEEAKKKEKDKLIKPDGEYATLASRFFAKTSLKLYKTEFFKSLRIDLIASNLPFSLVGYISIIFFTTLVSLAGAAFLLVVLTFFNLGSFPMITLATEAPLIRLAKFFWILFVIPIGTFFITYFYPSLEKKAAGDSINQELPFAAIHMAAISGSMVNPSKIFTIISSTKEYPHLDNEFTKLMNEINVYGSDLVSALKRVAASSPSPKLAELFTGLATTINSGGNLPEFFKKRSESLLFDYKLEREKYTKSAETFMDIYISVVIAAPMILMLLLIMMKISGLGIDLSTTMISLIMVLGVSGINIAFLTFLHLKQPKT